MPRGSPKGSNRGGGKPPLGPARRIALNIPQAMMEQIDRARGKTPRTNYIREAINMRLTNPPVDPQ